MQNPFIDEDTFTPPPPEKRYCILTQFPNELAYNVTTLTKLCLLTRHKPELIKYIKEYIPSHLDELNKLDSNGISTFMYVCFNCGEKGWSTLETFRLLLYTPGLNIESMCKIRGRIKPGLLSTLCIVLQKEICEQYSNINTMIKETLEFMLAKNINIFEVVMFDNNLRDVDMLLLVCIQHHIYEMIEYIFDVIHKYDINGIQFLDKIITDKRLKDIYFQSRDKIMRDNIINDKTTRDKIITEYLSVSYLVNYDVPPELINDMIQ